MNGIQIGRLLRASTSEFTVGCHVSQMEAPTLGALVRAPLGNGYHVYGLIYDINIEDDGLVRQLVTSEGVNEAVIADNRINRNVPVEISVLTLGYRQGESIRHLLPPRPPLSLDMIYQCDQAEIRQFTTTGGFSYFRHILRARDLPVGELLAAHLEQAQEAHSAAEDRGWSQRATKELIALLRDDYPTLMSVLTSIAELDG
jgi:hypothetical protein